MFMLHTSEIADLGLLVQSQAFEPTPSDNPGVGTKQEVDIGRGTNRVTGRTGGAQHDRWEPPVGVGNQQESHPCPPEQSGGQGVSSRGRKTPPCSTTARVGVVDRHGDPQVPGRPAREPVLLASGRARVHLARSGGPSGGPSGGRLVDKDVASVVVTGVEVGIDPGPKFTGLWVFRATSAGRVSLVPSEVRHRGQLFHKKMQQRSSYRRGRRSRHLRYRPASLDNRTRPKDGLTPSLRHLADTTLSMVARLRRWAPMCAPVSAVHQELVWFDMEKMENHEVAGVEYQQGTLAGDEVREYLRTKWGWTCAYCGATGVMLNIDHILPKASGDYNRVSNLALNCAVPSYQSKVKDELKAWGTVAFGPGEAGVIAKRVLGDTKALLKDTEWVNTTRWALYRALRATGLPVTDGATWAGGCIRWKRCRWVWPETRTEALCVGDITGMISDPTSLTVVKGTGRGKYSRTTSDRVGLPPTSLPWINTVHGFATGDLVRAVIPKGKYTVVHVGRVAVRSRGMFRVTTVTGTNRALHRRHCTIIQRADPRGLSRQREGAINVM